MKSMHCKGMTLRNTFSVDSSPRDESVTVYIMRRFTRNVSLCLTSCRHFRDFCRNDSREIERH